MVVEFMPGAKALRARPRGHDSTEKSLLAGYMAVLPAFNSAFLNLEAVWASRALCISTNESFRLEKSPRVMYSHEAGISDSSGAMCSDKLHLLHGYWQMPLAFEAQEVLKIITLEGLYTAIRVPPQKNNETFCFRGILVRLPRRLKCKMRVDDVWFVSSKMAQRTA